MRSNFRKTALVAFSLAGIPTAAVAQSDSVVTQTNSFIAAVKDDSTSTFKEHPKCADGQFEGSFVMNTPKRDGFPLDVTTIGMPSKEGKPIMVRSFVTTAGDVTVDSRTIDNVAAFLKDRLDRLTPDLMRPVISECKGEKVNYKL